MVDIDRKREVPKKPAPPEPDVLPPGRPGEHDPGTAPGRKEEHRSLEGPNVRPSNSPGSRGEECAEDRESLKSERNRRRAPEKSRKS
jgi:hypothetical protein